MDQTKALIAAYVRNLLLEHPVPGTQVRVISDLQTELLIAERATDSAPRRFRIQLREG